MERIKRAVSLILCFVMVFGLLPMHAFAAEGETEPVNDITTQVEPMAETGSKTATGNLKGGNVYTLDTDGVTANKNYLIVSGNSGDVSALTNNGSTTPGITTVNVSGNTITVEDDSKIAWKFSGTTSGSVGNNGRYVYPNNGSLSLNTTSTNLTINSQDNGAYKIFRSDSSSFYSTYYYLRYNNGWTGGRAWRDSDIGSVYLYELTSSSSGETVTFTVTPGSGSLKVEDILNLTPTVLVDGNPASNYTITWSTGNNSVATVADDGTVFAAGAGSTTITATLTSANNAALVADIVLTIPVTVTAVTLTGISVSNAEGITTCVHKDADFSDVTVTATYSDGNTATITEDVTFTYEKAAGEQTVTVTYEDKTATFPITVEDPEVTGKTLSGPAVFTFGQGTSAVFSGLTVQYTYACGCTEENPSGLNVSGYDVNVPGTYENCPVMLNGEQLGTVTVIINEYTPVVGEGNLVGSYVYTLDTDGINAGEKYLIVNTNSDTGYALTNNGTNSGTRTPVTISGSQITVADDTSIAWIFSGSTRGTVKNGTNRYIYLGSSNNLLSTSTRNLTFSDQGSGAYRIYYSYYYLRYSNNTWQRSTTTSNVYLYRQTGSTKGDAVVFTIDRDSLTLKPGQSTALNATVTLNGQNVALGNCEIAWSSNNSYASVSGGNVTGNADGTSVITATLTAVNGEALASPITLNVTVKVQEVAVANAYLTGNGPREVSLGEAPDFSNIKYVINYLDGSQKIIDAAHLTFDSCDVTTSGNKVVGIYYNAEHVGNVMVTVTADFSKLDPATNYPEYPNNGAVRINKFASHTLDEFNRTGVTRVELDVAGISVEDAVDVILIMDISNSMSWNDVNQEFTDNYDPNDPNERLNIAKASAQEFVKELMKDNGDNDPNTVDNTLTMLAFAGIDKTYNTNNDAIDDVFQIGDLAMSSMDEATAALDELRKANYGGTNYDYAFQQAYALAQQLYAERGNRVYVVFMTDGVPTHYNGVYYKSRSATDVPGSMTYLAPGATTTVPYRSNGKDMNDNSIDIKANVEITYYPDYGTETATKTVRYNKGWSDYVMNNKNDWAEQVKSLDYVAHVYAIGFGMKNGSVTQGAESAMPDAAGGDYYIPSFVTHATLQNIASDANSHFEADDVEALSSLYRSIATQIKFAGTEARVTDIVDQNFSVQMESNVYDKNGNPIALNTPPSITIKTYDLYPRGSVDAAGNNITGKRTGTAADIETVTFAMVNGKLQAYSSVIGSRVNILTTDAAGNITISAKYFTYTKDAATSAEKFVWTIGNITDKEIALAFDAYLEGSMQGLRPQDVYYTNEEAILEYVDINGKYAKQIFPIPGVAWGGASTTIRFYLVNEKGEPVNRSGEVIPWENRIYVGDPVVVALNLNADLTIDAQKIEAAAHVPAQFFLYDINAYYTVQTTSSTEAIAGGITVSEPSDDARKTTGTAPNAVTQTGAQTTRVISAEEEYYTWSYVGFGVRWDLSAEPTEYVLTPDQIVIDYGKAIQVDVLANDVTRNEYNRDLVGFIKYTAGSDLGYVMENPGSATFSAEYGNFSIVNNANGQKVVQFQPTKFINKVQRVFYAVKYTEKQNTNNFYYVWGQLDIIPATIVYYETNFATGVFTTNDSWHTKVDGTNPDGPQDDGTIGVAQTYGYDSSYDDDNCLSDGTSLFAIGQGVGTTTVTFSFTGTGFDLISRTGEVQGLINAQIATDPAMENVVRSVSVLNKSDSKFELYQIPVLSVNNLPLNTYYVKIGVEKAYTSTLIPMLNRGGEFYFDAVRIYDPVKGDATAEKAYRADGEANNSLDEVRALLLDAETYAAITGTTTGMVFVDKDQTNVEIATYRTIGPNNEVYLSKNQAVAFKVNAGSVPASFDIGAKTITGSSAKLQVTIRNAANTKSWTVTKEIKSSTVQFIDLLKATGADAALLDQGAYVVITNVADNGILSITDVKTAFSGAATVELDTASVQDPNGISTAAAMSADAVAPNAVSFTVDGNILSVVRSVLENTVEPEEPTEPSEPEVDTSMYNIIRAYVKKTGSVKNVKYTITVVTTQDVEEITVSQGTEELKPSKISYKDNNKNSTREWTIVLTSRVSELYDCFTLIGAGKDGTTGEAFNVTKPR